MFKLLVATALLVVAIHAQPAPKTPEQVKSEMLAAGLSEAAATGIMEIGEKYKDQFEAAKGNKEALTKLVEDVKKDTDAYIQTQPAADQTAYAAFAEKMKADLQAQGEAVHV